MSCPERDVEERKENNNKNKIKGNLKGVEKTEMQTGNMNIVWSSPGER